MSHKAQAAKLRVLGVSHREAARALNVPPSVFSRYLLRGKLTRYLGADFGAKVDAYLKTRAVTAGAATFKAKPMIGHFSLLGMSLVELAEAVGVDFVVLKNGIYRGTWPDEKTKLIIEGYIDQRINQNSAEGKTMINAIPIPQEALEIFGLKFHPFGPIRNLDDILVSREIAGALKLVKNAIERGEMIAVTGPVGCGKTVLLQKLEEWTAKRSDIAVVRPAVLEKQYLRGSHLIDAILEDLGCSLSGQKTLEHRARFVRRALEQAQSDGRIVVLVLDEMHLAETSVLLCLKRLWEIEKNCEKLLRIVIVGQPGLARALKTNFQLTELGQRIHLHELGGLNGATSTYLRHRLDRAGANGREIFDAGAVKLIAKKCATPLEVNCLASQALVSAFATGDKIVSAEDVETVHGGSRS